MPPKPHVFSISRWVTVAVVIGCVVVGLFHYVDMPLTQMLHARSTPFVFAVFDAIEELGSSELYLVPALGLYIWALMAARKGWTVPASWNRDSVARASLFVIMTMALGGIVTALLKAAVARSRPELLIEHGIYRLGVPFSKVAEFDSFPSSHTQAAFAVAAALAVLAPRWRWPLMIIAAAVAMARLVNLDHYLSDVVAAAAIAITSAAFLAPRVLSAQSGWPLRTPWRWFRT